MKFFEDDQERWDTLSKLRYDIAKYLKIKPNSKVLDVLVGYADFSRAIAKTHNIKVTAIEITDSDIAKARKKTEKEGLQDMVEIIKMDATGMKFPDNSFDYVVNFIGCEDLTAISGEEGVEKVFSEMVRVLKRGGTLLITFIPEIKVTNEISKKDKELENYIWLSKRCRIYFNEKFFRKLFRKYKVDIIDKKSFQTKKHRIKPNDAKRVLKWGYDNYESFYPADVKMRPYEDIIEKFKKFIDKYGIEERISHVTVLIGKKL